ncbi:LEAF RUST 10 DISEASE-RESISTANCE LOCUS RECEPTOR-LIKE PROTEIN KINASE-like 1.2 isoform X2 [Prunus yedoensis var. nudiflora]|uniref:LEAF RUST 10 DISEASE-RESISTANCE LOCUS RECEPTOR-LIKE PROTEIN KINASE-like 1.2 isoform X2 n=1 Tax=Prunus yedoensis var. nudiflora TaxID=2094558 RepID=A0A314Y675_PRUYE|nr:LEAF RUST 10 DISEASE-RESISTANCE LOCUS RECEPTOR-LIKE PROTEIN KINASE-like 1.2 isoform X2 [Prunus yedoensis var. nudiflora]
MNQNLCILILMFLLLTEASFALDFYYQHCSVPVSCGRLDISYPFYIQGKQESFCGYPGFQLSCHGDGEDAYPLLQLSGNNYTIHNIDYQNKSLLVSNSLLSGYLSSTACNDNISSLHNLTFPNDQYKLASNQADFFLLYNCNSSVVESFPKYKVGCFDQPTNKTRSNTSVLALPRDEYPKFGTVEADKCGGEVVVAYAGRGVRMGGGINTRGFEKRV